MAVSKVQDWSTPLSSDPSGTATIGSGTSRVLIMTINYEFTGDFTTPTVTVGGQANTGVNKLFYDIPAAGDDLFVYIYYWDEAAIDAMSGSSISYSDSITPSKYAWSYATFNGVDQVTPCVFSAATGATVKQSTPLVVSVAGNAGDYVVVSTTCRSQQNTNWDVNITEQWDFSEADAGGAQFSVADTAWNTSTHSTYQSTSNRSQAATGIVIQSSGSIAPQAMYHLRNHGKFF